MTVITAPDRSLEQRRLALQRANAIRASRARLKNDITAGVVDVRDILRRPPAWATTMKVWKLLISIRGVGQVKVHTMMRRAACSPSKTVDGLSVRQRRELCDQLERYAPANRMKDAA